jgi:hypothetical protein
MRPLALHMQRLFAETRCDNAHFVFQNPRSGRNHPLSMNQYLSLVITVVWMSYACEALLSGAGHARMRRSSAHQLQLHDVEGIPQAFIGGTVGVMSVAFIVELKKLNDRNLERCPYCMGNGEILCGQCLGARRIATSCVCCGGRGLVTCINCKGDGRGTPVMFLSKAMTNPVRALSALYMRCFF